MSATSKLGRYRPCRLPAVAASLRAHSEEIPATHPETARHYETERPLPDAESHHRRSAQHRKSCGVESEMAASPPVPPQDPARLRHCGSSSFPAPLQT